MNYNNCDIRLRKVSEPAREIKPRTAKPHRKPASTKLGAKTVGR
ncbi:MAG: hypothetical protein ACAI35_09855 [Candidatus Methylacidiphilales bacterium]|nr:hypothetical protein [Candidatus Methylacidiphilales bacterium]